MKKRNCVFYEPSMVGKSYTIIIEALRILGSDLIKHDKNYYYTAEEYKNILNEYDNYRRIGRIEYISFHDSYSYNEFMEGGNSVGCFKTFSQNALFECIDIPKEKIDEIFSFNKILSYFMELYPIGSTIKLESTSFDIVRYGEKELIIRPYNKSTMIELKYDILRNLMNKNINKEILGYEIKEILAQQKGLQGYYYQVFEKLREIYKAAKISLINEFYKGAYRLKNTHVAPYVLIIEEIDRGNISKVFGELLSLLDEENRNVRVVRLPYSQERFILPENLYILGTISTPRKVYSVSNYELLMRKFAFESMAPKPDLVADFGCNFSKKFALMNARMSLLLGSEYQIGHGIFLKEKYQNANISVLQDLWFTYVYPKIRLYFQNQTEKLPALLGMPNNEKSCFIRSIDSVKMAVNTSEYDKKNIHLVDKNEENFNFKEALEYAFGTD